MASTKALPFPNATNDQQYADDLDSLLGAPLPIAPATEEVTSAWVQSESSTLPGFNGLGTELYLPGATPDPSNPHVFDYPTLQEGLQAAVDELAGGGPQTTPLDPQFVAAVKTGDTSVAQLVADIRAGDWDGSPDNYDANAISSKLANSGFSVTGSTAAPSSSPAGAQTDSFAGGSLDPLNWPGEIVGSAVSSVAGSIGVYILKGVLTLIGGGLIVYGATLLTDRKSSAPAAAGVGAGAAAPAPEVAELAPEAALAA